MAVSGKYGKLNIPGIKENEPVFILRAQDKLAELAIQGYRLLLQSHELPMSFKLEDEIARFQKWPGNRKWPD